MRFHLIFVMTAHQSKSSSILYSRFPSPVGSLHVATMKGSLIYIGFDQPGSLEQLENLLHRHVQSFEIIHDEGTNEPVHAQLQKYFNGSLRKFTTKFHLLGTDFQLQVWTAIRSIAYGTTVTYKTIAHTIGNPDAMRAVGQATGRNPLPIIIPCHRVIGEDGALTGFGGGIETKRVLLRLEGVLLF
jgi:methylated-DNA-[protein]-cysteine S-methyltransferase